MQIIFFCENSVACCNLSLCYFCGCRIYCYLFVSIQKINRIKKKIIIIISPCNIDLILVIVRLYNQYPAYGQTKNVCFKRHLIRIVCAKFIFPLSMKLRSNFFSLELLLFYFVQLPVNVNGCVCVCLCIPFELLRNGGEVEDNLISWNYFLI